MDPEGSIDIPKVTGILLRFPAVRDNLTAISDLLRIPSETSYRILRRFRNESSTVQETVSTLLQVWVERDGRRANMLALVDVFKKRSLSAVAGNNVYYSHVE